MNFTKNRKTLNAYGRKYLKELLTGIIRRNCFPSVLKLIEAIEEELIDTGTSSQWELQKLRQIYFRTTAGKIPPQPAYYPFEERD